MGRLILVRHGQASFAAADYDQLSPLGARQARATGAVLAARGLRPDVLVRGGLRRHEQTARSLVEGAGWTGVPVRTEPGWDEIDHLGLMPRYDESPDHQDPRTFQAAYERALRRWIDDAAGAAGVRQGVEAANVIDPPGSPDHEPFARFVARVVEGLQQAADEAGPGRTVVVVTSAGPLGVACASPMQDSGAGAHPEAWMRWNSVAVNCALTTVVVGRSGTRLLSFNEHGHLAPDQVTFR